MNLCYNDISRREGLCPCIEEIMSSGRWQWLRSILEVTIIRNWSAIIGGRRDRTVELLIWFSIAVAVARTLLYPNTTQTKSIYFANLPRFENTYKVSTEFKCSVFSVGNKAAADKMASNLSIFSNRSILLSDKMMSMSCIDSVRLVGSEFRGEITPFFNKNYFCE